MDSTNKTVIVLEDIKINVKIKISALWAAVTLCYLYGDFIGLIKPGKLQGILAGKMGSLGTTTQEVLLGIAILMVIPCAMVFLTIALKPQVSRWANIIFGTIFTIIMLITMRGAWNFYIFLGVVEIMFTVLIIWYAWSWPKQKAV